MKNGTKKRLAFLFAAAASAFLLATAASAEETYPLYIGRTRMEPGQYFANGAAAASNEKPASGGYAYYEGGGKLFLNNFEYNGEGYCFTDYNDHVNYAAIYREYNNDSLSEPYALEVLLTGENTVRVREESAESGLEDRYYALLSYGSINISDDSSTDGRGVLNAAASASAIYSKQLHITINNCDVNASGEMGYGIGSNGSGTCLTISNSSVKADGGIIAPYIEIAGSKSYVEASAPYGWRAVSYSSSSSPSLKDGLSVLYPAEYKLGKYGILHDDADETQASAVIIAQKTGKYNCEHTSLSAWEYDAQMHWRTCTAKNCFLPDNVRFAPVYEEHEFDESGKCECGAVNTGLVVGNMFLADGDYLSNDGTISRTAPSGGYVHYSGGTLTMNGYEYRGTGYDSGDAYNHTSALIFCTEDLNIVLADGRTNSLTASDTFISGILVDGDLAVSGKGTLDILCSNLGIHVADTTNDSITVSGSTLDIWCDHIGIRGSGIRIADKADVTVRTTYVGIDGDTLTLEESSLYIQAAIDLVRIDESIAINGNVLTEDHILTSAELENTEIVIPEDGVRMGLFGRNSVCIILNAAGEEIDELKIIYRAPVIEDDNSGEGTVGGTGTDETSPVPHLTLTGICLIDNGETKMLPAALGSRRTLTFGEGVLDVTVNGTSIGAAEKYTVVVTGPMTVEVIREENEG